VGVYDAWQHHGALSVYNTTEGTSIIFVADSFSNYFFYAVTLYYNVSLQAFALIDYGAAFD
jgi:hypothetical protein